MDGGEFGGVNESAGRFVVLNPLEMIFLDLYIKRKENNK